MITQQFTDPGIAQAYATAELVQTILFLIVIIPAALLAGYIAWDMGRTPEDREKARRGDQRR